LNDAVIKRVGVGMLTFQVDRCILTNHLLDLASHDK